MEGKNEVSEWNGSMILLLNLNRCDMKKEHTFRSHCVKFKMKKTRIPLRFICFSSF